MESENIKKLKELTPRLSEMVLKPGNPNKHIEYQVENGFCIGFPLYKNGDIAVQRAFLSKDAYFGEHIHENEVEILTVYDGKLKGLINGQEEVLDVGDCIRIEKGVPHDWYAVENTWMIGMTIPASRSYPYA